MLETDPQRIRRVWNQRNIPVILRRGGKGQHLRIRLPFAKNNRDWLRDGKRLSPEWVQKEKYWETPKAWFNSIVDRILRRYGKLYVIQPYREQEICAPACLNATGHECQCSCMGANHGAGNDGSWFEVNETFATRWDDQVLACRLIISNK